MTVIAFKEGIFAADTATFMSGIIVGHQNKIRVNDEFCWSACGAVPEVAAFEEWAGVAFGDFRRPAKSENFGAVIIYRDGRVFKCGETMALYDVSQYGTPVVDGAECGFLMGVMAQGGSAINAVHLAIKQCVWAGGTCTAFDTRTWEWVLKFCKP